LEAQGTYVPKGHKGLRGAMIKSEYNAAFKQEGLRNKTK